MQMNQVNALCPSKSGAAELLRRSKLFIWDEAPMAKRWAIENVDKLLKDVMGNDQFRWKVVVFGGDFRQVLPVVPKATIHQTISASLVRVGNGEEPTDTEGNIRIPEEMIVKYDNEEDSIKRLIRAIFPSLNTRAHSADYMTGRAILAAKMSMLID
ncbi:UNVERIFIED_CONTAM: hypothetical protein Sradi_2422600 [Sesamum radiatum]|uniref:ATP-dependent DNA helicase n=1 Tax=Sesamum radiatum TaxID=300843 RepID=A0AAW2SJU4_SESRA